MLVSGTGTILDAILASGVPVTVVIADRPCRALARASSHGIESVLVDRRRFGGFTPGFQRARYTEELTDALVARGVDVVAMAGFGTVLTARVHDVFDGRILNTHPSLLPAFPGWRAVADALAAGVRTTGCTVHVATPQVDAGPVLAQEEVPVLPGDTESTLHERIKGVERRLYPATILDVLRQLDPASPAASSAAAPAAAPASPASRP